MHFWLVVTFHPGCWLFWHGIRKLRNGRNGTFTSWLFWHGIQKWVKWAKWNINKFRSRSVLGMWNPEALSAANISPLKTLEKIIIFFTGTEWKVINSFTDILFQSENLLIQQVKSEICFSRLTDRRSVNFKLKLLQRGSL